MNPFSDYELDYGLYDYNLDQSRPPPPPVAPYQGLPSPTYQTEFDEDLEAGGFFSDYFEGPRADFQGQFNTHTST